MVEFVVGLISHVHSVVRRIVWLLYLHINIAVSRRVREL